MRLHTSQNGHHKQINKQVLETMWRKGNPSVLLVGMQTGAATVERKQYGISSKKLKMDLPFDPAIPLLGLYPKNPEMPIQKNLCTPMFIAAHFKYSSTGSNLSAHHGMSGTKSYDTFNNGILCSRKKEGAATFSNSMDGAG